MENIKINLLKPNDKNPRNDLGDLTELVDSIKSNGIMQNLTVVKDGSKYTVVIGHRRLAAAKQAGLKEVPCEVKELSLQDQAQIMLMENMQRSDLTITEQAKGFQTCLDLGIKEVDIAKKTGLSKTTIKNRITLNKFDLGKVQKGIDKGAKIDDFLKLTKIKDKDAADELLNCIGTSSFSWKLEQQINDEKRIAWKNKIMKELNDLGVHIIKRNQQIYSETEFREYIRCPQVINEELKNVCAKESVDVYMVDDGYGMITIRIIDHSIKSNLISDEYEEDELSLWQRKKLFVKPYLETAYQLRTNFMQEILKTVIPVEKEREVFNFINELIINEEDAYVMSDGVDNQNLCKFFGLDEVEPKKSREEIIELINSSKNSTVLLMYLLLEVGTEEFDFDNDIEESDRNEYLTYKFLKLLGYEMSPEEQQLYDGTHLVYEEMKNLED
ncbi:MAG: ParB/RepB/Spo0J family partition protein [Anaerorhabdus sp.]|uniref:ParB/RepB/Spo0J family partition protein n=1 Tax=Anaerorhabdus sp. TaxID=1872524 RepID=UPI003A8C01DE